MNLADALETKRIKDGQAIIKQVKSSNKSIIFLARMAFNLILNRCIYRETMQMLSILLKKENVELL